MSYIEFNGKRSTEFGLKVTADVSFQSPEKRIEFIEIDGVDGEYAIDKQSLKNTTKSFPCVLTPVQGQTIENQISAISNWLKTAKGWQSLIFGGEPDFIYTAMSHQSYPIDRMFANYGKAVLTFTIKPTKLLTSGVFEEKMKNGQTLYNDGSLPAKPLITIVGTGNISVRIGESVMNLRGVDKGIIIDCKSMVIKSLDGTRPAGEKVSALPLPTIPVGFSKISWTGNVTEVRLLRRWEAIV